MPPFGSPTENPKDPHHTNGDHSNDGLDLNLVGVTIHNLSQSGIVLEQSDHSDKSDRLHDIGAVELINTAASRLSLYDRYRTRGVNHTDVDDDDIIRIHAVAISMRLITRGMGTSRPNVRPTINSSLVMQHLTRPVKGPNS